MDWIVGVGDAERPADVEQAVDYVRTGSAPGPLQLVVRRAATGEYLNLFLTWERAMLFWVSGPDEAPQLLIARRPRPSESAEPEVAFAGRTPDQVWWIPSGDTLRRSEGLALLEEYAWSGTIPTEVPAWAAQASMPSYRQLLLFEETTPTAPESRAV